MKKRVLTLAVAISSMFIFTQCSKDDGGNTTKEVSEKLVVENYANIVVKNYEDALSDAKKMQTALENFTKNPSETTLENAKKAWLQARESYGPSEAYRFAGGPIDAEETSPEGLLNAWPLDEQYIDYVTDPDTNKKIYGSSIINDTEKYPTITKELLESLNENGGEENVSVGYHAIEFLLWGQDLTEPSANKPGMRPFTDYTTAPNADRRKKYLLIAGELIQEHLTDLINEWKNGGPYRNTFVNLDSKQALGQILTGIATLSKAELAGERMLVAVNSGNQEDEHSCFSDNTHRDIRLNFDGIENVYLGHYNNIHGASIADLLKAKDPKLAEEVMATLKDAKTKVYATGKPFDMAISGGTESIEGKKVKVAVLALQKLGDEFVKAGKALGVEAASKE